MIILIVDYEEEVFVNRKEELEFLERLYNMYKKRTIAGVIVYGIRRVGKTTLIEKFLADKNYIKIVCGGISNSRSFLLEILDTVQQKFGLEFPSYASLLMSKDISEKMFFWRTLKLLNDVSGKLKELVVFLDEVHIMLDAIARRISREEKTNTERGLLDMLWIMKGIMEEKKAFWILSASLGWEKTREILQMKHREAPLLLVLERLEVKPLKIEHSVELIRKINPDIPIELAERIADLSGGIPKIAIILANSAREEKSAMSIALKALRSGAFDDVFDNIIRFAATVTRFSYNTLLRVVASISQGYNTTQDIATKLSMNQNLANSMLNELVKLGLLKKTSTRPVIYKLSYPLLASWAIIKLKDIPLRDKIEMALTELGITTESYIREIIAQYEGKQLVLVDDKAGTYLAGTIDELRIEVEKVFSKKETDKFFGKLGIKNGDIIIKTKEETIIIEVKAGIKNLRRQEVAKLSKIIKNLKSKKILVKGIIAYYGLGKIDHAAVAEAVRNNIIIITREGIKTLAKKVGLPIVR